MHIKKSLLIAGVTGGVALTSLAGASAVYADARGANGPDTMVKKIAQKFNLKEADVKAVFDEERNARHEEHEKEYEEKLTKAVSEGKLTSTQKDKLLAKHEELEDSHKKLRGTMKDKTPEERRASMDAQRKELEQWAKDNNIPTEYLPFGKANGMGGPKGRHYHGDN